MLTRDRTNGRTKVAACARIVAQARGESATRTPSRDQAISTPESGCKRHEGQGVTTSARRTPLAHCSPVHDTLRRTRPHAVTHAARNGTDRNRQL